MLESLKEMFGLGPEVDYKELMKQGAQIVDVRTKAEFTGGHIGKAVNMPLGELSSCCNSLKKDKPVITCCASGVRSAQAKSILLEKGFTVVHNGCGWRNLNSKL
ncbi:MAG: sulfurtransferase [Bacteroidetes bacterium 37-13]|nr:MAG: sulfurtransferase [Bacteroidetes bacterium 37-13]